MSSDEANEPLTSFSAELAGEKGREIAKGLAEQEKRLSERLGAGLPTVEGEQVKSKLGTIRGALHIVEFLKNFYQKGD